MSLTVHLSMIVCVSPMGGFKITGVFVYFCMTGYKLKCVCVLIPGQVRSVCA